MTSAVLVLFYLVAYLMIASIGGILLVYNLNTRRGPERPNSVHWIRIALLFVPVVQALVLGQQLSYLTHYKPRPLDS